MRKILCMLPVILLAVSLFGCGEKEKVTYYETRSYRQQSTGDVTRSERTYDENWNPLLHEMTLNENFSSRTEYEYSEDLTTVTTKTTSAIYEPETSTIIRTFDDKGQIIQAATYDGDRHISTSEYTYDDNGEAIFIRTTYPETDSVITLQRTYDDQGNLITYTQDTGYYVGRYEYTYNQKNQRIREAYYKDDELQNYTELVWEGNAGTAASHKADGTPLGIQILEYDEHGNLLRHEVQDLSGTMQSVSCFEYVGTDGSVSSGIPE